MDARPIKKIAEAKARKKMRAAQRLEKAMKKAEGVNETSDMTEREKAKQIEKLMQKGTSQNKKKEVKVVVAKGAHRGIKGRPKGVKGRYLMVDARMRKEVSGSLVCILRILTYVITDARKEEEGSGEQAETDIIHRYDIDISRLYYTQSGDYHLGIVLRQILYPVSYYDVLNRFPRKSCNLVT